MIGQSNGTSHFIQDKMFFRFVFLNIENLSIPLFKNGFSEMNLRTGVWTCIMKEVYAEFLIQKQASNSLFVLFIKASQIGQSNVTSYLYEIKYFPSFSLNKEVDLSIQFKNCTLSITVIMKLTGYELEFGHLVK